MRAILLAAGKGTRIHRHFSRPKSTIEVAGEPIIKRTVGILARRGFEVSVVLGYEGEFIRKCLEGYDVSFYGNPFYPDTNSIASLWMAREAVRGEGDLIVMNADVYWDERILDRLMASGSGPAMVSDRSRSEIGDFFFCV